LNAVDQDTSSKQEVATVLIYSCLKAVTLAANTFFTPLQSFNTQPPEDGWQNQKPQSGLRGRFNTQPPEGGWILTGFLSRPTFCFNTERSESSITNT